MRLGLAKIMIEEINQIVRHEAAAVAAIPVGEHWLHALDMIYEAVHTKQGKLIISGMGKAGQIAQNMATTFCSGGTPAVFLHPSDAQHGDLGIIRQNDVLLLISNSGKTREIIELVDLSANLCAELPLLVLTGNPDSPLAQAASVVLLTGNPAEVCPLGLTPTTSTTVMTVMGDVLVSMMMKRIGFTASDYAKRHHGGYLGDQSRKQAK